ncbi:hypothetical protein LRR81_20800 [Metabacillus sp. GX 13764]|uniref:hypothetical protein n=1 Tax=Metabacillus kandeliae TaxID=2900151 RepID=UPI001E474B99|nr:hypothetical protein [Metabacillus kandeliae]MCD7036693.1 hypothetical protein [Metabacillus kandeliae]
MVAVSSIEELKNLKASLEEISKNEPVLFQKWMHIVNLTRQFQFKYSYMGCLLTGNEAELCRPNGVKPSIIALYENEVAKLTADANFKKLQNILTNSCGYTKISRLSLGQSPESLVGASIA